VRTGVPNSVNLLHWGAPAEGRPPRCLIERWCFAAGAQTFERTDVTTVWPARA